MRTHAIATLLALLFVLCAAPGALAQDHPPGEPAATNTTLPDPTVAQGPTDPLIATYDSVARTVFPGSSCEGKFEVEFLPMLARDAQGLYLGHCHAQIKAGMTSLSVCITYVHEYGHGAGYVGDMPGDTLHSADPTSIMYPVALADYLPCRTALALPPPVVTVAAAQPAPAPVYVEGPSTINKTCGPGWAHRSTWHIRREYDRSTRRAYALWTHWAKRHPIKAKRLRRVGWVCTTVQGQR